MSEAYQVTIEADGSIRYVNKPELAEAFGAEATLERASHVEPVNPALRVAFRALRSHASDRGLLAAFTRAWPCRWRVTIINGPTFGPFAKRTDAIDAEVSWLNAYRL
jgi:hypothetical protein